jgi:hypothetical protein
MRRPHRRANARDVALSTVPIHESGTLKRTHGERLRASMVVVAGRYSDFGLPTLCRFPSQFKTVLGFRRATFRSHHRCGTAPDSHQLPV